MRRVGRAGLGLQLARVEHGYDAPDGGLDVGTAVAQVVWLDTAGHRSSPGDGGVIRGVHVEASGGAARRGAGIDCGNVREGEGVAAATVRQE